MVPQPLGRFGQVIAAAAHVINNEAVLLLSATEEAGTTEDDSRTVAALNDIHQSAARLASCARVLLHYVERHGVRASRDSIEALTDKANDPR